MVSHSLSDGKKELGTPPISWAGLYSSPIRCKTFAIFFCGGTALSYLPTVHVHHGGGLRFTGPATRGGHWRTAAQARQSRPSVFGAGDERETTTTGRHVPGACSNDAREARLEITPWLEVMCGKQAGKLMKNRAS